VCRQEVCIGHIQHSALFWEQPDQRVMASLGRSARRTDRARRKGVVWLVTAFDRLNGVIAKCTIAKSNAATGGGWPAVSLIWFQAAIVSSALAFVTETIARAVKASPIRMILFILTPCVFFGASSSKASDPGARAPQIQSPANTPIMKCLYPAKSLIL
jgi:hypothetical protein